MTRAALLPLMLAAGLAAAAPALVSPVTAAQEPARPATFPVPEATMPSGGVDVPIIAFVPNPVVEVRVNGQGPFRFLVDTGGQGLARADAALVARLSLPVVGQVRASDGSGTGTRDMDLVRLDSLSIGGLEFRGVAAASRDYNARRPADARIDGVLGLGLFEPYLLTLDFPAKRLRVAPGALPEPDGRTVLPFTSERGVATLPIVVGNVTISADIDTGSMGGLLLPLGTAERLPLAGTPAEVGRARTVTNEFVIYAAPLDGTARIGSHTLTKPTLQFSEIFRTANVGIQVLRAFAVTIDQANGRIRFEGDASAAAAPETAAGAPRRIGLAMAPGPDGLVVRDAIAGMPAERAGVRVGDVLVAVADTPVADIPPADLGAAIVATDPITLTVRRGSETLEIVVRFSAPSPR